MSKHAPPSSVLLFGTGQIGTFAAKALSKSFAAVYAADAEPNLPFYARFGPGSDAPHPVKLDVTDRDAVESFIKSHHDSVALVFAAGLTGGRAEAEPDVARAVAQCGLYNVLAATSNTRLRRAVVISSLAVYSGADGLHSYSEVTPTNPNTTYGLIQLALESVARNFTNALDIAVLRVAGVFGPNRYGHGSHSSQFIERVLYSAAIGKPVKIEGSWEDEDDIIYVKDVASAIEAAALDGQSGSFTINVGVGHTSSVREIADSVLAVFPKAAIEVGAKSSVPRSPRRPPLDSRDLSARLGVRPGFSLAGALQDFALDAGLIRGN